MRDTHEIYNFIYLFYVIYMNILFKDNKKMQYAMKQGHGHEYGHGHRTRQFSRNGDMDMAGDTTNFILFIFIYFFVLCRFILHLS